MREISSPSWKDLLTNYNGKTISYDGSGNPLSDGTWSYTWQEGRKLATMSNGSTTWRYSYDANGMRTQRTNGSVTYNYTYHGSQLTHMTCGNIALHFYYDASGNPLSVTHGSNTYYYVLNLQGDVVAILDSLGEQVVGYRYDAYGRLLATTGSMASTLGVQNPLRYRGYVYDKETGLYYLQSRYYNPEMGRFINADSLASTGQGLLGCNMFAYCGNNPVSRGDAGGHAWETVLDVISLASSVLDVVANPTNAWAWAGLVGDVVDVAIPFVGGIGEGIDALRVITTVGEGADAALDAARIGKRSSNTCEALYKGGSKINDLPANVGYNSFKDLKNAIGSAGEGKHWHHIVEQSQIGKSGFSATKIHNTSNIFAIDATTHAKITGYYNTTTFRFTNGLSVRNWLAGQSYEYQYEFGLKILREFGAIQ